MFLKIKQDISTVFSATFFRFLSIISISVFLSNSTFAQKDITLKAIKHRNFYPTQLQHIQWVPNTSQCSYVRNDSLFTQNLSEPEKFIIDRSNLAQKIDFQLYSLPKHIWLNKSTLRFITDTAIFDYSTKKNKIKSSIRIPSNSYGIRHSENVNFTYILNRNLFIRTQDKTIRLAIPKTYYVSDSIYRNEFGYSQGSFWSARGDYLIYICKNDSAIPDYHYISTKTIPPNVSTYKYAFAGGNYEKIKIGIYSLQRDTSVFLSLRTTEGYYTNPTFNFNENKIYLFHLNRSQDSSHLEEYDVETGKYIRTIFSETHAKYVEPLFPVYFTNSDSSFYFISRKNEYQHLYSYSLPSNRETQLTHGNWEISDIHINPSQIIAEGSSEKNPTNRYIYHITDSSVSVVDSTDGTHTCVTHPTLPYAIETFHSISQAHSYSIFNTQNNTSKSIFSSVNPLEHFKTPNVNFGKIVAADDSTELYYSMIKPPDFSENKQYPVIIDVYGGPHLQIVRNSWMCGYDITSYILASQGYIIFSVDNRGSWGRGIEFENTTHLQLGQIEALDQKKGIDFLYTLPYVDTNRIGTYGWSFGGFMSITLLQQFPEHIQASVAGSPVTDWKYYEVMYGERYMNTPENNPEGYHQSSLVSHVDAIEGNLLLFYGGHDKVTVPAQSIEFIETCNSRGIPIETHFFPTQEHHMSGYHKLVVLEKIISFFRDNL
ncbi:MAG: prolyl oligopeptidase family serine peptidase [Bacteroidales bacterium]|jgi:dipeptidyl-peptidase-4|nr:prolyl oligopeptidase family serine peptidase [Bacteroidales bacterium]